MLNHLDRMILNLILEQSEPVSGQRLAAQCGVSVNTIRKEISLINEDLLPHGCCIEAKAAAGFGLTVTDHTLADEYVFELRRRCRRNRNLSRHDSGRVRRIIRECLCSMGQLSVQSLCDRLYCSQSTLLRELNQAREAIAPFSLKLVNRKNSGLRVEGNEWHIRQCLIHQHKLWTLTPEEADEEEYGFKTQFLMLDGVDWYSQLRLSLIQALNSQQEFTLPFMSMPKILHYVQLATTRQKFADNCVFTPEQRARAQGTAEYTFARRWVGSLPDRINKSEDTVLGVAMLLLSYETRNAHLPELAEYEELLADRDDLIAALKEQWGDWMEADEEFRQDWPCFQYALQNRLLFQVYSDTEYVGLIHQRGIRSLDMCIFFARWYEKRHGVTLDKENTLSSFYVFHRLLWLLGSHRKGPDIVIFSRYGFYYAKAFAQNLRDIYHSELGQVTARELGEPWTKELSRCDLVVTDIDRNLFRKITHTMADTMLLEFHLGENRHPELDVFLRRRRVAEERDCLSPGLIRAADFSSKEEVFPALGEWLAGEGEDGALLAEQLRVNDQVVDCERQNEAVFLPVFATRMEKPRIRVFVNRTPIPWGENECRILVGYTRTPLSEENGIINSILKKFIYLPPELLSELLGAGLREDYEAFWSVLEQGEA